jgi:hypothetical protein
LAPSTRALAFSSKVPAPTSTGGDAVVTQHVAQAVGAKQVEVVVLDPEFIDFQQHRVFHAQRPGDQVFVGGVLGLLGEIRPASICSCSREWSRVICWKLRRARR